MATTPREFGDWQVIAGTPWYSMYRRGTRHAVSITGPCGGAAAIATDSLDRVLVIATYRVAIDRILLEIPRGFTDPGETPVACAAREMREETGIEIPETAFQPLGVVHPDSGILATAIPLFAARLDHPFPDPSAQPGEVLSVHTLPSQEFRAMVADGRITDAITTTAAARLTAEEIAPAANCGAGLVRAIEILDGTGRVEAEIETGRPDWSFDQYCRNRHASGRSWRFRA